MIETSTRASISNFGNMRGYKREVKVKGFLKSVCSQQAAFRKVAAENEGVVRASAIAGQCSL